MQPISSFLTQWALNKISQYKADQLKMTIGEAQSSDLYVSRDKTIAYLTNYVISQLNNAPTS